MTRISLKEAYDNKDVVTQIFGLRDEVDKHTEILENLPDPDLTNCVLKTGDQTIAGEKTFVDVIHADGGLDLANMGPLTVNGNLEVNGDIIQNGSAYETHAEQVFSANDYIVTRDGAVGSLPAGAYSGIQVKKYDGVSDCRLVVDNTGTARVGDINDEQPLLTRAESANMSNGALLKWDGVNGKAVSSPMDGTPTADSVNAVTSGGIKTAIDGAVSTLNSAISGKVSGTGNIGSDTKPIKIVNGVAVAVTDALVKVSDLTPVDITTFSLVDTTGVVKVTRSGNVVSVSFQGSNITAVNETYIVTGLPRAKAVSSVILTDWSTGTNSGLLTIMTGETRIRRYGSGTVGNVWLTITYITDE